MKKVKCLFNILMTSSID